MATFFGRRLSRHDDGFTLLEVIVAIAILALSAGVIFAVASDSFHNTQRADALTDASALAQTLLAEIGKEIPLQVGDLRGETGGLAWHLLLEPYGDGPDREAWPVAAYVVLVEVSKGRVSDSRPIRLVTLRLGRKGRAP